VRPTVPAVSSDAASSDAASSDSASSDAGSSDSAFSDAAALRARAYAAHGPLAARIAIYDHQQDRVDLPGLVVAALEGVEGTVLDAGCGTGTHALRLRRDRPDLRVVPLDLSVGMAPEVVGDLQALPLADGCVQAALAMHVLYHVPDIALAVRELRRVLATDGVLVVGTNGSDDKAEIDALWCGAIADTTGRGVPAPIGDDRFTLTDGDLLREAFGSVEVQDFVRPTVVPTAAPVVAYVDSMRGFDEDQLPAGLDWDTFLVHVAARVEAEIAHTGAWQMTNHVGVFTCRGRS